MKTAFLLARLLVDVAGVAAIGFAVVLVCSAWASARLEKLRWEQEDHG